MTATDSPVSVCTLEIRGWYSGGAAGVSPSTRLSISIPAKVTGSRVIGPLPPAEVSLPVWVSLDSHITDCSEPVLFGSWVLPVTGS